MRKFICMIFLFLLLTSCFKPDYTRPYIELPDDWRTPADENSTLCNLSWWEQFEDPVLNKLILIALENNEDLKVAIARVIEYYARLGVTNSARLPAINGNASYSRTETSITIPLADPSLRISDNFLAFVDFNWELDFWGRLRSASDAAYAELLGQVEARRAVVITVVSSVAREYIVLRQLDAQLDISRQTLESRRNSLQLAKDRFELGETSEIEVKQAESEVETAAIRVIEFERAIPQQENKLSILLGANPQSIVRGNKIEMFEYPLNIPAGLPSDLLLRRPDIAQAEDQLIAANARITEARALFYPQFTLSGMYGSQSDSLRQFLTNPAQIWSYGLAATQTIFDAGKTCYLVEMAKAIMEQALHRYRQTILIAFGEVEDALIASKKNRELVVENERQVQVLQEYLNLAKLRYLEGEIDYLNVLDAERSLFNSELQLAQAYADNLNAVVQLYKALGGGWVVEADLVAVFPDDCDDDDTAN